MASCAVSLLIVVFEILHENVHYEYVEQVILLLYVMLKLYKMSFTIDILVW